MVMLKKVLRAGQRALLSIIPENKYGDKFFAWIDFVIKHKRLPTQRLIFNDVLYKIKTTKEILDPLRVFVSDKELVKVYVKAIVGNKYNVPTIDVIRNKCDVDNYDFPADCCIKPTQASGHVILRKNNSPINKKTIKDWFDINYYKFRREANYKTLMPKVIIEPILFNDENINDYKFFCYNGVVKLVQVDIDRFSEHKRIIFDKQWNPQSFSLGYPRSEKEFKKPNNFDEMLAVAERLAAGFSFVRVDLYSDGKNCFVGEITNCHSSAGQSFVPKISEKEASKIIFG